MKGHEAPPTVLIVDDNPDNRALFTAYLAAEGYRTLEAETGTAALERVRRDRPDLVLLDVLLPDLSGFEVCQRLKQDAATVSTPVIMVTTLEDSDSRTRAFEADADEFLSKPVHRRELIARVRSMLRLRHALKALEQERQQRLQGLFERYVSKQVAERLLQLPDDQRAALLTYKERVNVAVMFTDVRGFTAMSDALEAELVVGILNEQFNILTEIAFRHGGTIFNMTGDGLLIGFGVPIDHPDPMRGAAQAGLEMQGAFVPVRDRVARQHGLAIGLGIGIHYGPAIVGNVGSEQFVSFTAIGDTINVAARIEQMAEAGTILLTEPVWAAAHEVFAGCAHDVLADVPLRGKARRMALHRVRVTA